MNLLRKERKIHATVTSLGSSYPTADAKKMRNVHRTGFLKKYDFH